MRYLRLLVSACKKLDVNRCRTCSWADRRWRRLRRLPRWMRLNKPDLLGRWLLNLGRSLLSAGISESALRFSKTDPKRLLLDRRGNKIFSFLTLRGGCSP